MVGVVRISPKFEECTHERGRTMINGILQNDLPHSQRTSTVWEVGWVADQSFERFQITTFICFVDEYFVAHFSDFDITPAKSRHPTSAGAF